MSQLLECSSRSVVSADNPSLRGLSSKDRVNFCVYASGQQCNPDFPTVVAAFEHNARVYPHAKAVEEVGSDGKLRAARGITYEELKRRAEDVALRLRELGITNGDAVGLYIERSVEMIVGIVAILKVGASYIPQDARIAPSEHLLRISKASGSRVVLTLSKFRVTLPDFGPGVSVLCLDTSLASDFKALQLERHEDTTSAPQDVPRGEPVQRRETWPSDVCYTIFTSGTTGTPKGVQVTHGNVANVLMTAPMNLGMRPGIRVSQILSISFDMGAWEMLGSLCNAACLVIRNKCILAGVKHVDIVIATPTVLGSLDVEDLTHIKCAAVAGEPCPRPLADLWSSFCTFYNSCGPTETTIVNTAKKHTRDAKTLTIGAPTPNNTVYILDPVTREPCAIGDVGEMWAGGRCVSAGYLGRPDLTEERYVYDEYIDDGSSRMYRTGDLARWDENGELEHYGRVDDQVKIKGFRVELDGVSAVLERSDDVSKAVALEVDDGIVAFVTPADIDPAKAKATVAASMPYYCVPSKIISLPDFPLTGNGKVDKKMLFSKHISTAAPNLKVGPSSSSSPVLRSKAVLETQPSKVTPASSITESDEEASLASHHTQSS